MNLHDDIIYEILWAIDNYEDCIRFAMICKGIWAIFKNRGPKIEIISGKTSEFCDIKYKWKSTILEDKYFRLIASDGKIDWNSGSEDCKLTFTLHDGTIIKTRVEYSYKIWSNICEHRYHRCLCDREKIRYYYIFGLYPPEFFHKYCKENYKNCEKCCRLSPEYIQNNAGPLLSFRGYHKLKLTLNYLAGTRFVVPEC